MASATTTSIGEGLRGWGPATAEGLSDESLLEQFLSAEPAESEEAFRRLVARHGPMVLGVCRHILDQVHDAEDAFQATFLVLARNAGAIRDRRVLARWLYEVAYRIALRSRSRSARRRGQEKEAAAMSAVVALPSPETDPAWSEPGPSCTRK
ncbi:MAG: sigma-70 family RNA polymerase sigma factor [Isosphaeraceae bacterium]